MNSQRELDNLFGMNNEAAAFLIILKDFADVIEIRLKKHPEYIRPLIADMQQHSDEWFRVWCDELGMKAHLVIFASAAKLLLQEYSAMHLLEVFQTLEKHAASQRADDQAVQE